MVFQKSDMLNCQNEETEKENGTTWIPEIMNEIDAQTERKIRWHNFVYRKKTRKEFFFQENGKQAVVRCLVGVVGVRNILRDPRERNIFSNVLSESR